MATLLPADAKPSSARAAVWLPVEFAAFATLLFVTRFIARGYLAVPLDEECHVGGIAVDVLANGIRFPSLVYVQSDYDNGALLSGLLAAGAFTLLGRSVLALKLVAHAFAAAGAVAALWLLRGCMDELGLRARAVRWTATVALAIAIGLAPEVVTLPAMCTVSLGSPLEGSVIGVILLALFARHLRTPSIALVAGLWSLVGLALYLNKAMLPIIPVLGAAQLALWWRSPLRLLAAAAGFLLGVLPEVGVAIRHHGLGWTQILGKVERHARDFPFAFADSVWTLAEHRLDLVIAWLLALGIGGTLLMRSLRRWRANGSPPRPALDRDGPPVALALVVGTAFVQTTALAVMAQGGFDYYTIYGYPTLAVLFALLVAWLCARATARWGAPASGRISAVAVLVTLVLYRPGTMAPGFATVAWLWRNDAGAACSWRLAEGFRREGDAGLGAPGLTREQHIISRCRSLSEPAQVIDCIGGIARDLQFELDERVDGAPPAELTAGERRAYAYYYGIRRNGDLTPCDDFTSPELRADCAAAVVFDCLVRGGWGTSLDDRPPRCAVPEPPMDGYWAALRRHFLTHPTGLGPRRVDLHEDRAFPACKPVFDDCYGSADAS